jgi:hypothetical protein
MTDLSRGELEAVISLVKRNQEMEAEIAFYQKQTRRLEELMHLAEAFTRYWKATAQRFSQAHQAGVGPLVIDGEALACGLCGSDQWCADPDCEAWQPICAGCGTPAAEQGVVEEKQ